MQLFMLHNTNAEKLKKKTGDFEFPYCFLTGFTKFFLLRKYVA